MKKHIILLSVLAMLFLTGTTVFAKNNVKHEYINKLSADINAVGYFDAKELSKDSDYSTLVDDFIDFDLLKEFETIVFGAEKINPQIEYTNINLVKDFRDYAFLLYGSYNKRKMIKIIEKELGYTEQVEFDGVDAVIGQNQSILFLDNNVMALTSAYYETKTIKAYRGESPNFKKDTVLYKNALSMNNNLFWLTVDLSYLGERQLDLDNLGFKEAVRFQIGRFGVSKESESIDFDFAVEFDNPEHAKKIASALNPTIPFMLGLMVNSLFKSTQVREDILEILGKFKLNTKENTMYTRISMKITTFKSVIDELPKLLSRI